MDDLTAYVLLAGVVLMWVVLPPTCHPDGGREEAATGVTKALRAAE